MMSTFRIVLTLNKNDDQSIGVAAVLAAVCGHPQRVLSGCGGYLHGVAHFGRPERILSDSGGCLVGRREGRYADGIVAMCMLKYDASGALVEVTEADRSRAEVVLKASSNVRSVLVGPIESDDQTSEQMDASETGLVNEFIALQSARVE